MKNKLERELMSLIFRLRKLGMTLPQDIDIHMSEFFVMKRITENIHLADKNCFADIQNNLLVTKPAISQILNSLEKKGYINREIDTSDRRKINITPTPEGVRIVDKASEYVEKLFGMIIQRYGEENIVKFIELFNQLVDISDEVSKEIT